MAQTAKAAKLTVFARLSRYITDVKAEMKRVVWPSRQEVINSSGIVITTLIIFVILILIFDQVSLFVIQALGKLGG